MTVDRFRLRTVQNFRFDGERHTSAAFQTKKMAAMVNVLLYIFTGFYLIILGFTWTW